MKRGLHLEQFQGAKHPMERFIATLRCDEDVEIVGLEVRHNQEVARDSTVVALGCV